MPRGSDPPWARPRWAAWALPEQGACFRRSREVAKDKRRSKPLGAQNAAASTTGRQPPYPFPPRSLQAKSTLSILIAQGAARLQTACAARRARNSYTLGERLLCFGRLLSYCLGAISCGRRRFSYLLGLLISYFLGESSYTLGAASKNIGEQWLREHS